MSRFLLPIWALVLAACQVTAPEEACQPGPKEKKAWDATSKAGTPEAYRKYLARYPEGCFAPVAAKQLKKPVQRVAVASVAALGNAAHSSSY